MNSQTLATATYIPTVGLTMRFFALSFVCDVSDEHEERDVCCRRNGTRF